MYLTRFTLERVKCFDRGVFEFPRREDGRYAGWHVVLGANATGKTTALRAMAISLMGPAAWKAFEPVGWVRHDTKDAGRLEATIAKSDDDAADRSQHGPFHAQIDVMPEGALDEEGGESPLFVLRGQRSSLLKSVYAPKKSGWFSCAYGPYRRLSGGGENALTDLKHARQHRVASLFRESVALTQCEEWLKDLHHMAHDEANERRKLDAHGLSLACDLINSMLPASARIAQVSSAGVRFETASREPLALADLSDGYRSFLAFGIDIVRRIFDACDDVPLHRLLPANRTPEDRGTAPPTSLDVEGVVLIDEVDVHLHPSWQRRIGPMLQRVFPNIQFIVSTHSPFVAQSASEGGLFVLHATQDGSVEVVQPVRSVRGWRADAMLMSPLFGLSDTVDIETERRVAEYHALASKRAFDPLSHTEQAKLDALETELSRTLISPGETVMEFERRRAADAYVEKIVEGVDGKEVA